MEPIKPGNRGAQFAGPFRAQGNPDQSLRKTIAPPPTGSQKQRDGGRQVAVGISVEKYNQMAAAYFDIQSVNHVATTCNVTRQAAKKYIEVGDLKRGMPPIKQRFLDLQRKVQRKQERTWESAMEENRSILFKAKAALAKGLGRIQTVEVPAVLDLDDMRTLSDIIDKITRTESFMFGGPDSRADVRVGGSSFADWTDDEVDAYIRDGRRPAKIGNRIARKQGDDEGDQR